MSAAERFEQAVDDIVEACDGFLRRAAIRASLTPEERLEILRGMLMTRATDNRLKAFFTNGEVRYGESVFQGKGFRSLGQEAIYGAAIRLRRGDQYRDGDEWRGDVVAPLIRDLGVTIAMRPEPEMMRRVLSAQMGKAGPPMNGKDLHVGDMRYGIWPAIAPLGDRAGHDAGLAFAFAREGSGRVALSFIGEGGSSLGEWHEAINLCAVRKLPAVFALAEQSDRVVHAGSRSIGGSRVCRQGDRLWHPWDHDRRNRSGRDCGGVPLGGGTRARWARTGVDRIGAPCACAVTRTTTTCCISARIRRSRGRYPPLAERLREPRALRVSGRRAIRFQRMRRAWKPPGSSMRRHRAMEARGRKRSSSRRRSSLSSAGWPSPTMSAWACSMANRARVRIDVLDPRSVRRHANLERCRPSNRSAPSIAKGTLSRRGDAGRR